jgi:hypothetical protein
VKSGTRAGQGEREKEMTMKSLLGVIGVGILTLNIGCARETPTAPSALSVDASGASSAADSSGVSLTALTTTSYPVVTLQPDLTANPAIVTVRAGDPVLMINNSEQFVRIRSSNCSEFSAVWLNPGASKHTWPFSPAGKKCYYFVWKWPDRVFEGQVAVN